MKDYTIMEFPSSRFSTFDVGVIGRKKHHMAALVEVDVTEARKRIREEKLKGKRQISFTAWFLKSLSGVLEKRKDAHAIRYKKNKLIYFDSVDISMPVEKEVNGKPVPIPLLLRNVSEKSISDLFDEIRNAKNKVISDSSDYVLGNKQSGRMMSLFLAMPQWLRLIVWRILLRNPFLVKEQMGSAIVTSVGSVGRYAGWILPKSMHTLAIGLGSIIKKPRVVNDRMEIREILHMTVLLDHDVIDGAPAARFVNELVDVLESGNVNFAPSNRK